MYFYNQEFIVGSHVIVTTATILLWEVLSTMDDEINFIWLQPWTLGTFLFIANRYLPFIHTILALHVQFTDGINPQLCDIYYRVMLWMVAVGLFVSELVISLRTYAIWGHRRSILYVLLVLTVITSGITTAGIILENHSFKFEWPPEGGVGCKVKESGKVIVIPYIAVAFSETSVVCLTIMRGFDHFRSVSRYSWVSRVYGYGLLFYIYLLIITVANIVIPFVVEEPRYKGYFAVTQHVLHSIFCTRVIMLIQRQRWARHSALSYALHDHNDDTGYFEHDHNDAYAHGHGSHHGIPNVNMNVPMTKVTPVMPMPPLAASHLADSADVDADDLDLDDTDRSLSAVLHSVERSRVSSSRVDWTQ